MSLMIFERDKREEMKERYCDISSPLNSLPSEEMNLFTNSNNHFLAFFSQSVQKFEAQNMENEESLDYNIKSQFLDFLTTIRGTKPIHGIKAKGEGMGKELSVGYEDTLISLSLNHFLLCHELSFKELKLFLELNSSYVILVGNCMVNPFTCELAPDIDHMFKCSSPCAYLEKELLVSIARINHITMTLGMSYTIMETSRILLQSS
ncbi:hypothetical protein M9H77_11698 [Catharanthus roseus]|uniref:Uncharacterized protein n=1 Tax=Catharanthus roseus TaxID=4058 RepID=A0ACC0BFD7_CATRO|nr:hypothetical protein M9H77_11698 [Catharanthus roseus]